MKPRTAESDSGRPTPTPPERCRELAARGDLLGLIDYVEERADPDLLYVALPLVHGCIRQKARTDLSGLCEDAFGRIVAMTMGLLVRVQLYISFRLQQTECSGCADVAKLPADLLDEGWVDRAERLARFFSEMVAVRARVAHVNTLSEDGKKSPTNERARRNGSSVAACERKAATGEGTPGDGRLCVPTPSTRLA